MTSPPINRERLQQRLDALGDIGADREKGTGRTRLALSDDEKRGRDLVCAWMTESGATVQIDQIGNLYGIFPGETDAAPVATGSHIDTVSNAGKLDGCYGVLAGIEILASMKEHGMTPKVPVVVIAFSNEEGVRFSPDLLGSRVIAKEMSLQDALVVESRDGKSFGSELQRIGYAGEKDPWRVLPRQFVELHIEQGPVLEAQQCDIGIVHGVQGHSWWQIDIEGCANHAGTTPMQLRKDAGAVAMQWCGDIRANALNKKLPAVATVGSFTLSPNAINVVPGRACFSVDFRDADDGKLREVDALLQRQAREIEHLGFTVRLRSLSRAATVLFDARLCDLAEVAARKNKASTITMMSGASHDAQMMARICPTTMIFVPSENGISHNPREFTSPSALALGAQILSDVIWSLARET